MSPAVDTDGLARVRGRVATMAEAIAEMESLEQRLDSDDGLAAFNRMYLEVTRLVADEVGRQAFAEPEILGRLDVVFANRYLGALAQAAAGASVPGCWRVLLARRHDASVHPLQFALVGMNAHINHDLVLALNDVFRERGRGPHDRLMHRDFIRVNELLGRLEHRIRQSLLRNAASRLEHDFGRVEDCLGRWSIARARSIAWHDAAALWEVRAHPHLVSEITRSLDAAVAAAARCLLLPLPHHRGERRRCGCPDQVPHLSGPPELAHVDG